MESYAELYSRARHQLIEEPQRLLDEVDRVLGAAKREVGEPLEQAVRLSEMALVARLDPWWTGPPQGNLRQAIARVERNLHDPLALSLGLRLAAGYTRLARVDDEAHRLARLGARLVDTGLAHPEAGYAREAARHVETGLFLPSAHYVYALVRGLTAEEAGALVAAQLTRGNPTFAALAAEMHLVRALDDWYVGPPLPNVEGALEAYRATRPAELHDVAVLLARAYVKGGSVDLRARDHVQAVLAGDEAQLLGPDEAVGLQEYVDRGCFDYPYGHLYAEAKRYAPDELRAAVRRHTRSGNLAASQRLCEMILVRRLDDWYVGDPSPNVRAAIDRYLEAGPGRDGAGEGGADEVTWCARYLAGLYAATLDGSGHARALVRGTVAREPDAEPFVEALRAAGIPADVTVEELYEVFQSVVEIEARVDAFRAMAEAAGDQQLTEYEREAYAEVLRFLERGERTVVDDVAQTLGSLVEVMVPDALLRSVAGIVEGALRVALDGASATLRRDRILGELSRRDPALRSLERIRTARLDVLDEVAWSLTLENRVVAALEGLGCGLGGVTLVLVDLPMLVLVNLNALAAIATCYGFDVDAPEEREFLVALLAGGAGALRHVVAGGAPGHTTESAAGAAAGELLADARDDLLAGNRAALALHTAAARIASRLAKQKLVQVLPILGGAVGAGLNFHFTHTTTRTAVMAYRYRWLMRRFLEPSR